MCLGQLFFICWDFYHVCLVFVSRNVHVDFLLSFGATLFPNVILGPILEGEQLLVAADPEPKLRPSSAIQLAVPRRIDRVRGRGH